MALLFIDGFDNYGTGTGLVPNSILGWRYSGYNMNTGLRDPRVPNNGRGINASHYMYVNTLPLTTDRTLIVGFALMSGATNENELLKFNNGLNSSVTVYHRATLGELEFYRSGSTFLGRTSGARLSNNRWSYIEIKIYIDNTAGTLDVQVDGANCLSLSGIDTQGITENFCDQIEFLNGNTGESPKFDDLYICDGSGAVNNDFLGPCYVRTLRPESDVVGEDDWTPQTPGDHYAMVDEVEVNEDTDYVESGTPGDQDLWEYEDTPAEMGVIFGIQICTDYRLTDAIPFDLQMPAKLNSTTSEGAAQRAGSTEYETFLRIMETDPEGNPWTDDNLDATQFGVKVA